jgi:hypothetical protein
MALMIFWAVSQVGTGYGDCSLVRKVSPLLLFCYLGEGVPLVMHRWLSLFVWHRVPFPISK